MASEITESYTLTASKSSDSLTVSVSKTIDMAGAYMGQVGGSATTSWGALTVPSNVTAPAHLVVTNRDSANYFELAVDSGGSYVFAKVLAGESVQVKRAPAMPYIRANTAAIAYTVRGVMA